MPGACRLWEERPEPFRATQPAPGVSSQAVRAEGDVPLPLCYLPSGAGAQTAAYSGLH